MHEPAARPGYLHTPVPGGLPVGLFAAPLILVKRIWVAILRSDALVDDDDAG